MEPWSLEGELILNCNCTVFCPCVIIITSCFFAANAWQRQRRRQNWNTGIGGAIDVCLGAIGIAGVGIAEACPAAPSAATPTGPAGRITGIGHGGRLGIGSHAEG